MPSVIASHVVALAAGTQTALFVDLGASVTTVTPIVEGFYVDNATRRIDLGCDDIAAYMGRLLSGAMEFVEGGHFVCALVFVCMCVACDVRYFVWMCC